MRRRCLDYANRGISISKPWTPSYLEKPMTSSTHLSPILENKRLEVRACEALLPLAELEALVKPSTRNYAGGFILECKKASPSEGLMRADFNIEEIAKVYAPFAGAISVLTDQQFFQGKLDFMAQVSNLVSCPVLCKDFIISPYHVYEARLYQADMILFMLSVLDDQTYRACAQVAQKLDRKSTRLNSSHSS